MFSFIRENIFFLLGIFILGSSLLGWAVYDDMRLKKSQINQCTLNMIGGLQTPMVEAQEFCRRLLDE
jgi:hypothetical protein